MEDNEQKIRQAVKQYIKLLIKEQEEEVEVDVEVEEELGGMESMPTDDDEMISRFPALKKALISLMGKDYKAFISDIKYVAPKPTTFQIDLGDEHFNLMWAGKRMGFVCIVQGKKYYLIYLNEKEQAIKAINRLLRLGSETKDEAEAEEGGDVGVAPGEEIPSDIGGGDEGGVTPDEL